MISKIRCWSIAQTVIIHTQHTIAYLFIMDDIEIFFSYFSMKIYRFRIFACVIQYLVRNLVDPFKFFHNDHMIIEKGLENANKILKLWTAIAVVGDNHSGVQLGIEQWTKGFLQSAGM